MEEKVIRTVEKAVTDEKSVLEQLKEKTTDLMTQLKSKLLQNGVLDRKVQTLFCFLIFRVKFVPFYEKDDVSFRYVFSDLIVSFSFRFHLL